jgi:hypothetical protein
MINIIDFTSKPRICILLKKNLLDISEVEKLCSVDWPNKEAIISSCKEFEVSLSSLLFIELL